MPPLLYSVPVDHAPFGNPRRNYRESPEPETYRRRHRPLHPIQLSLLGSLSLDLETTKARRVICLGDSFDAPTLQTALPDSDLLTLTTLQAGLDWVWIEGNHDPGPVQLGGTHRRSLMVGPLNFRHIAKTSPTPGEVTGHYHPKATLSLRGRALTRPCFLFDDTRLILPAYGAFTGGLHSHDPALACLMSPTAEAILTGPRPCKFPMPGRTPLS